MSVVVTLRYVLCSYWSCMSFIWSWSTPLWTCLYLINCSMHCKLSVSWMYCFALYSSVSFCWTCRTQSRAACWHHYRHLTVASLECVKGVPRSGGRKSPNGVQIKTPVGNLGDKVSPKLKVFVNTCLNFDVLQDDKNNKTAKNTIIKKSYFLWWFFCRFIIFVVLQNVKI